MFGVWDPIYPDEEAAEVDLEEQIAKVIRKHDLNQLFVAFTATPSPGTVSLFGKPFDSYTEAEAIADSEGLQAVVDRGLGLIFERD